MSTLIEEYSGIQPKVVAILEALLGGETVEYIHEHPPKTLDVKLDCEQLVYISFNKPPAVLWEETAQKASVTIKYLGRDPQEIAWFQRRFPQGWLFRSGNALESDADQNILEGVNYVEYGFVVPLR